MRQQRAPDGLSVSAQSLWRSVTTDYSDMEEHHLRILEAACRALSRMDEARALIDREGLVVEGRTGPRPHPGIVIENQSRIAFARLIRELGLDTETSRPPTIVGVKRGRKGQYGNG